MIMVQHLVAANAFGNQTTNPTKAATSPAPPTTRTRTPSPTPTNAACSPATPTEEPPHSPLTPVSPKQEEANSPPATPTLANTTPTLVQALSGNNWHKQQQLQPQKQNTDFKMNYDKDTSVCAINAKDDEEAPLSPTNIVGSALTPAPTPTTSPTSASPVPPTTTTTTTAKLSCIANKRTIDTNSTTTTTNKIHQQTTKEEEEEEEIVDCVEEFAVLYSHLRQRKFQTNNHSNNNNISTVNKNNLQLNLNFNNNKTILENAITTQPQIRRSVITSNSNNNNNNNYSKIDNSNVSSSCPESDSIKSHWHRPSSPVQVYMSSEGHHDGMHSDDSSETPDISLLNNVKRLTASNYAQQEQTLTQSPPQLQQQQQQQQQETHISHTLLHSEDNNNSLDVTMNSPTPTTLKNKRPLAYISDDEDEEEYPLDLSINAATILRNNVERTFSGTESDDSLGGGVGTTAGKQRRRNNAKHLNSEESSAAYKKSLMKRYCKFI